MRFSFSTAEQSRTMTFLDAKREFSLLKKLLKEPHRIFFLMGIFQGILCIFLLGLSYGGLLSLHISIGHYHAYSMAFIVFAQFFIGYLLSVFKKDTSRPIIRSRDYFISLFLINNGAFLFLLFAFISSKLTLVPMVIIVCGYLHVMVKLIKLYEQTTPSKETMWMLIAFGCGGLSQLCFIADYFLPLYRVALSTSFYLFLFFIVINVSQKMMPFFTASSVAGYMISKSPYFLETIFGALLLKVVCESMEINTFIADSLLFAIVTHELLKWRLPFSKVSAMLWVLFLSMWWIPVAFGLFMLQDYSALFGKAIYLEKSPVHTLALGYFTTILVGFGTRVMARKAKSDWNGDSVIMTLFCIIQLMTLLRIFAGIFPRYGYTHAILSVAGLWVVLFVVWAKRYIQHLLDKA